MPSSLAEVISDYVLLAGLLLPTGLAVLHGLETTFRRRFALTSTERVLFGWFAVGGLFYVVGSIPAPLFGRYATVGVLVLGTAAYVAHLLRRQGAGLRHLWEVVTRPVTWLLIVSTLALLVAETSPVWNHLLPDTWDGSDLALWVTLTVNHSSLPWTLQPYANAGVTYPMGTTMWATLTVYLLGWTVASSPILLPPLFLALSVPAAFAWGQRLGGVSPASRLSTGLVFAGFFGALATYPRLLIGGNYDLVLALPLLLVLLGFTRELVTGPARPWQDVIAFSLAAGVLTSVSPVAGEALGLLVVGFVLVFRPWTGAELRAWLPRLLALIGIQAVFVARSIAGILVWYGYPGHVLVQTGPAGFQPTSLIGPITPRLVNSELNPFIPWKARMSPFPFVSVELQVLLVVALALWVLAWKDPRVRAFFPPRFQRTLVATAAILFCITGATLLTDTSGWLAADLAAVTNFNESSFLFFLALQAFSTSPVVAAVSYLGREAQRAKSSEGTDVVDPRPTTSVPSRRRSVSGPSRSAVASLAVVLLVFGSGLIVSGVQMPGYVSSQIASTANVTGADIEALQWAGAHLPHCSQVLVAPGSAAEFLPEYADVGLVYQMTPTPWNETYFSIVADLSSGVYSNQTRAGLLSLGVTEVFVTGQSQETFPAFDMRALESSVDFAPLFLNGDAGIFAFNPGIARSACPVD